MDVQITKLLQLSFLFSGWLGRGRGSLKLTLLDKFITKPAVLLNSSKFCHPVVFISSGYSLVVLGKDMLSGGRGGESGSDITKFFSNHSFPFFFNTIKLIWPLVYQSLNSYLFYVFWNVNLSQTVRSHIIAIYVLFGKFIHVGIWHFTCKLKKSTN